MKIIDPGHKYKLDSLDGAPSQLLTFVKRCQPPEKYPGNSDAYGGIQVQEVLRALIERCLYVNNQIGATETEAVIGLLRQALLLLELRAARRHGHTFALHSLKGIENLPTCVTCGHWLLWEHEH